MDAILPVERVAQVAHAAKLVIAPSSTDGIGKRLGCCSHCFDTGLLQQPRSAGL